ncbi:hypothetical protein A2U01_0065991, partial [Trifolium medium]|nr:hypothetical protein [Trifolium medium]
MENDRRELLGVRRKAQEQGENDFLNLEKVNIGSG